MEIIKLNITTAKTIEEINVDLNTLKMMPLDAIETAHAIGLIGLDCKAKMGKAVWVNGLCEAFPSMADKDDRSACMRLASHKLSDLQTWVKESKTRKINPRSLIKDYSASIKPANKQADMTELEKTLDNIKTAGKTAIADNVKALENIAKLGKLIDKVTDNKTLSLIENALNSVVDQVTTKRNGLKG